MSTVARSKPESRIAPVPGEVRESLYLRTIGRPLSEEDRGGGGGGGGEAEEEVDQTTRRLKRKGAVEFAVRPGKR
jgi:hypothetical protein